MRLKDKVIIVTGGNGLLGKSIISEITKEGGVAINADINQQTNAESKSLLMDVTDTASVTDALTQVSKAYGRIDGLVNSAYPRTKDWGKKFEDIDPASWKQNVDMQMNSIFVICQQVLQIMKAQKAGSIVNISSIYGSVGPDFSVYAGTQLTMPAAYAAIKGGLVNFSRYLAAYYGPYNVRVNCVSPGGIFDHQPATFVQQYESKVPLKRMGTPGDIAPSVCFLLSDDASYITGHNLMVDGGWTAI